MKKVLSIFCVLCIVYCAFAKVVVIQKTSEPYFGNASQACERKMEHKNIEVVNHLKYFEVKKKGKVVASFDPVNIDRNSLYIWSELSPNGKMLLFSTSDQGVFVVNLKGEVLCKLGKIARATNWWNNRYIIGMIDEDDGDNFIKSDLVMIDIKTGELMPIETEEEISLYPCANKPYVEYFTLDDKKHTIELRIKN
jgi:hypothetical protein